MKISTLCPIHRWGGLDMLFAGLEHPEKYPGITFNKKCKSHYKGIPGTYGALCKISTPLLTFEEIVAWREKLEHKYKSIEKLIK